MYPLHDRAEGAQGELGDFEELLTINLNYSAFPVRYAEKPYSY